MSFGASASRVSIVGQSSRTNFLQADRGVVFLEKGVAKPCTRDEKVRFSQEGGFGLTGEKGVTWVKIDGGRGRHR